MPASLRTRYLSNAIQTATPARLVTMLYDALVSDLAHAQVAMGEGDHYTTNEKLTRAQAIVLELNTSLKPEVWSGGPALRAVYVYLYRQLVRANLTKDASIVAECLTLVEPLQSAWHSAAQQLSSEPRSD